MVPQWPRQGWPRGGGWGRLVVVMAVVIAGAAGVLFAGLRIGGRPALVNPSTDGAQWFPVVLEPFDDSHLVRIEPTSSGANEVKAGRDGVLNHTDCRPGGTVESGTTPWTISGQPVIALATAEPLYRDLRPGSRGSDVRSLQDELARLGFPVDVDGSYGPVTRDAVQALRARNDLPKGLGLALADISWLPGRNVTTVTCLSVGSQVARGEALATIRPRLESARIMPMPEILVPGQRQVSIDGAQQPFVVDQAGAVSAGDLDRLVALPMTAAALESKGSTSEVPLSATLTLRTPVDAATLPASAVVTDNRVTCVITQDGPAIVSVVSSTVGQSVVSFVGNASAAQSVRLSPGPEARCG